MITKLKKYKDCIFWTLIGFALVTLIFMTVFKSGELMFLFIILALLAYFSVELLYDRE